MGRKVKIDKETILKVAFEMLVNEGYDSINIKSLANAVGCSTQPIAWHFQNMDGLRNELFGYCANYINENYKIESDDIDNIIDGIIVKYINLPYDYPNLYRYLYMDVQNSYKIKKLMESTRNTQKDKVIHKLVQKYNASSVAAEDFLIGLEIFCQGLALRIANEIVDTSREEIIERVNRMKNILLKNMDGGV